MLKNMQTMYSMCAMDVQLLKQNLAQFLDEGASQLRIIGNELAQNDDEIIGLFGYDLFMTRAADFQNLVRKLNIYLMTSKVGNSVQMNNYVCRASSAGKPDFNKMAATLNAQTDFLEALYEQSVLKQHPLISTENVFMKQQESIFGNAIKNVSNCTVVAEREFQSTQQMYRLPSFLPLKDLTDFKENYVFIAAITHIADCGESTFFVCQTEDNMFLELSKMLDLPALSPPIPPNKVFGVNSYKGKIKRAIMQADERTVYLIDCAAPFELTEHCNLYDLPTKYQNMPAQAIRCILVGCEEPNQPHSSNDSFHFVDVVMRSESTKFKFEVVRRIDQTIYVKMLDERIDFSNSKKSLNPFIDSMEFYNQTALSCEESNIDEPKLIEKECENIGAVEEPNPIFVAEIKTSDAVDQQNLGETSKPTALPLPKSDSNTKKLITITIIHVAASNCFYSHVLGQLKDQLPLALNTFEVLKLQEPPKINDIVLAQFSDGLWYRARIVGNDNNQFKAFFVDYGNIETLSQTELAECPQDEVDKPFCATRCCLVNSENFENTDLWLLQLMIQDKTFEAEIIEKRAEELIINIIDPNFIEDSKLLFNDKP